MAVTGPGAEYQCTPILVTPHMGRACSVSPASPHASGPHTGEAHPTREPKGLHEEDWDGADIGISRRCMASD